MTTSPDPIEAEPASNGRYHPKKLRAIQVEMDDGSFVHVHEPAMKDMGTFLRALPALSAIEKAFDAVQKASDGVMGMPVEIPDHALEGIFPLIAIMTDITEDEFKNMALFEGLRLMKAFSVFAPKNPKAVATA